MAETTGEEHRKRQQEAISELLAAYKHFKTAGERLLAARTRAGAAGIGEDDIDYIEEAAKKGWL